MDKTKHAKRQELIRNLEKLKFVKQVRWESDDILRLDMDRPIIRHSSQFEGSFREEVGEDSPLKPIYVPSHERFQMYVDLRYFEEEDPRSTFPSVIIDEARNMEEGDEPGPAYQALADLRVFYFKAGVGSRRNKDRTWKNYSYLSPHFTTHHDEINGIHPLGSICTRQFGPLTAIENNDAYAFVLNMYHVLSKANVRDNLGLPDNHVDSRAHIPKSIFHYRGYETEAEMKFMEPIIKSMMGEGPEPRALDPDVIGHEQLDSPRHKRIKARQKHAYKVRDRRYYGAALLANADGTNGQMSLEEAQEFLREWYEKEQPQSSEFRGWNQYNPIVLNEA